jgi:hypothetical protein
MFWFSHLSITQGSVILDIFFVSYFTYLDQALGQLASLTFLTSLLKNKKKNVKFWRIFDSYLSIPTDFQERSE